MCGYEQLIEGVENAGNEIFWLGAADKEQVTKLESTLGAVLPSSLKQTVGDTMERRVGLALAEIIGIIRRGEDVGESYCVYCAEDVETPTLSTVCYLDDYPEIDDDDEETYSEFVISNNLELLFREELIQDVILNINHHLQTPTDDQIMMAINYYNEKDAFMEFKA